MRQREIDRLARAVTVAMKGRDADESTVARWQAKHERAKLRTDRRIHELQTKVDAYGRSERVLRAENTSLWAALSRIWIALGRKDSPARGEASIQDATLALIGSLPKSALKRARWAVVGWRVRVTMPGDAEEYLFEDGTAAKRDDIIAREVANGIQLGSTKAVHMVDSVQAGRALLAKCRAVAGENVKCALFRVSRRIQ